MNMWKVKCYIKNLREKIEMKIAWMLPKKIVMWCAIRVGAHATTGIHGSQIVPDLKFMDAIQRWEKPNK